MSNLVRTQKKLLAALSKLKGTKRRQILINANKDLVEAIAECVHNTLIGNITLTERQKLRLKKHRKTLRKIGAKKIAWKTKKQILINQKGDGFFSFLLPIVSSLIGALTG